MEHYNSVHMGLRPFVCDGCGLNFSRKSNMTKHQRKGACKGYKEKVEQQTIADLATNNVRVSIGADGGDTFICDKCDKVFKYKQSFRQHIERFVYVLLDFTTFFLIKNISFQGPSGKERSSMRRVREAFHSGSPPQDAQGQGTQRPRAHAERLHDLQQQVRLHPGLESSHATLPQH